MTYKETQIVYEKADFWVLNLGLIVIWVVGILNAMNGKEEKLPIIGKYADNLKI